LENGEIQYSGATLFVLLYWVSMCSLLISACSC